MESIKKFFKKNYKGLLVAVGSIVVICVLVGVVLFLMPKKSNEEDLKKLLEDMGKDFYVNYLYDSLTENDKQNFLERISVTGMKLDLDNIGRYDEKTNKDKIKQFVNSKTGEECSQTNTYFIVYANAPYGKNDFTIEVNLDCGFDS